MAEQDPSIAQPPRNAPTAAAPSTPQASDRTAAGQGAATAAPPPRDNQPAATANDPIRALAERLDFLQASIGKDDKLLARRVNEVVQEANDPTQRDTPGFRHRLAYAVEDVEKTRVGRLEVEPALRAELTQRAAGAPGLENERMQALLVSTAGLVDKKLVQEIRKSAGEIGRRADQTNTEAISMIDALENRLRLSEKTAVGTPAATGGAAPNRPAAEPPAGGAGPDGPAQATRGPEASRADAGVARTATAACDTVARPARAQSSVIATIMRGLREGYDDGRPAPPWDPKPTSMADRFTAFEKKMTDASDERAFEKAAKSGRATIEALQGFTNGEGAAVLSRIQDAAIATPGGMPAVLSEMRDGGRFSDLRKQFNGALAAETGIAAAYETAAGALARYGQDRGVVQDIAARRQDISMVKGRFEEMDAEIGKSASLIPSKNDGKSMIDDLSQKAAEMFRHAVETVKSIFRSPSADASSRAAPSPSPG